MLNPVLHKVLQSIVGNVRVCNENMERISATAEGKETVTQYGESYYVDCWCCGDTKSRLSISYKFLTKKWMSTEKYTHVFHCFNENCNILETDIFRRIEAAIEDGAQDARLLEAIHNTKEVYVAPKKIELPVGYTPITELPETHPALGFIAKKYKGLTPSYLWAGYRVGYTSESDPRYLLARNRVIFPVFDGTGMVGWQGRSIDKDSPKRWYLPPGFNKSNIYNFYRLKPGDIPVIAEGIPAAISCGPCGIALFGKDIDDARARVIADKVRTVIIATDPETFIPDPRSKGSPVYAHKLKAKLDKYLSEPARVIHWPAEALELARRKVNGEKELFVPDPADMGLREMKQLIDEAT